MYIDYTVLYYAMYIALSFTISCDLISSCVISYCIILLHCMLFYYITSHYIIFFCILLYDVYHIIYFISHMYNMYTYKIKSFRIKILLAVSLRWHRCRYYFGDISNETSNWILITEAKRAKPWNCLDPARTVGDNNSGERWWKHVV